MILTVFDYGHDNYDQISVFNDVLDVGFWLHGQVYEFVLYNLYAWNDYSKTAHSGG